ncbi:MAG TPA: GspH/FimT family pseudopilin [Cellvibrio sp.]|nr:GspH/FimT family pseudopilin [Cellvibrio sp.]
MNSQRVPGRFSQGFTLIEILAVVIIIGLIISIVALSVNSPEDENNPNKEAQKLRQELDFVSELAVLNGEIVGLFVEPKEIEDSSATQWCYHWQRFRSEQWEDLPKDTLSEHCMSETIQMDLEVEGKLLAYDPDLETQPPVLVWSPSGEATGITITLFTKGVNSERKVIDVDLMGVITGPEKEEEK